MKSSTYTIEEATSRLHQRLAAIAATEKNIWEYNAPTYSFNSGYSGGDSPGSYFVEQFNGQFNFQVQRSHELKVQASETQHALDHINTHPQLAFTIFAQENAEREEASKKAEALREAVDRRLRVREKVNQVIRKSELTSLEQKEGVDAAILKSLASYMKTRSEADHSISLSDDENLTEIEKRADAINRLISLIKSKNVKEQLQELKEENIVHLKGVPIFGSKKLYTLFSDYRKILMKRPSTVELRELKRTVGA